MQGEQTGMKEVFYRNWENHLKKQKFFIFLHYPKWRAPVSQYVHEYLHVHHTQEHTKLTQFSYLQHFKL